MVERIQKILSARGIASRRKAEEMIQAGRVSCNGKTCVLGDTADPETDEIAVDGAALPAQPGLVYIMLHKPRGFVTTMSDEKGRKNAAQLVDCGVRVYPVGRLDMDSEGLLLFTNDGDFANRLMHPKHQVDKTYRVTVVGYTAEALEKLGRPMELDGYPLAKAEITLVQATGSKAQLLITIHEGRNRQVRRMCALVGLTVTRLVRICEGAVSLGELPKGKWRYLTDGEIKALL